MTYGEVVEMGSNGNCCDLTGQRFGRLKVVQRSGSDNFGRAKWECLCLCGKTIVRPGYYLTTGDTQSCGCTRKESAENLARSRATHGMTKTPEFGAWGSMLARCYNPKSASFKHYGGRGIKVCERWVESFANFLADMGRKPGKEFSLDRIDVNGNYAPENCRWATPKQQQNNKRPVMTVTKVRVTALCAALDELLEA